MARWRNNCRPDVVLSELMKLSEVGSDGKIRFKGFGFQGLSAVLDEMVEFDAQIPHSARASIVRKSCFEVRTKGDLDAKRVMSAVSRRERQFLRQPNKKYYLISRLSLPVTALNSLPRTGCLGSTVTFPRVLSRIESDVIGRCFEKTTQVRPLKLPRNYVVVRVSVSDRSPEAAGARAIDNLDLIRSTWNLGENRMQWFRHSSGERRPVNRILLGPIQTLHNSDGSRAFDSWWYEPNYRQIPPISYQAENTRQMMRFQKEVFRLLNRHKYKKDLVSVLLRYVRALDSPDWQTAILKLWGILETLTDTLARPYKVTISRASAIYESRDLKREELNVLRNLRNRHAHFADDQRDPEAMMYILKNTVEDLIEFHLGNRFRFSTLQEMGAFLDMPASVKELRRLRDMYNYAINYRTSTN